MPRLSNARPQDTTRYVESSVQVIQSLCLDCVHSLAYYHGKKTPIHPLTAGHTMSGPSLVYSNAGSIHVSHHSYLGLLSKSRVSTVGSTKYIEHVNVSTCGALHPSPDAHHYVEGSSIPR